MLDKEVHVSEWSVKREPALGTAGTGSDMPECRASSPDPYFHLSRSLFPGLPLLSLKWESGYMTLKEASNAFGSWFTQSYTWSIWYLGQTMMNTQHLSMTWQIKGLQKQSCHETTLKNRELTENECLSPSSSYRNSVTSVFSYRNGKARVGGTDDSDQVWMNVGIWGCIYQWLTVWHESQG